MYWMREFNVLTGCVKPEALPDLNTFLEVPVMIPRRMGLGVPIYVAGISSPNEMPCASGSASDQLTVLVWRRM